MIHLQKVHPAQYAQLKPTSGTVVSAPSTSTTQSADTANSSRQLTLDESVPKRSKYGNSHPEQIKLSRMMAYAWARHSIAYRACEDGTKERPGPMQKLLMKIPHFDVPNRKELGKGVQELAQCVRTNVKASLSKMSKVCLEGKEFLLCK